MRVSERLTRSAADSSAVGSDEECQVDVELFLRRTIIDDCARKTMGSAVLSAKLYAGVQEVYQGSDLQSIDRWWRRLERRRNLSRRKRAIRVTTPWMLRATRKNDVVLCQIGRYETW